MEQEVILLKKYKTLILWTAVLVAIFAAAYLVYDRYGGLTRSQLPGLSAPGQDPAGETGRNGADKNGRNDTAGTGGQDSEDTDTDTDINADADDEDKILVPDFTLKDLDGNDTSLSDYRDKTVILSFWTTWCMYCVEEMRDFNVLDKELEETGDAVILAVNVGESLDFVKKFVEINDLDLKVLLDEDEYVSAGIFGISGFPNTFIINDDGSLYAYIPGKVSIDTMRELIEKARNNEPLNEG